MIVAWLALTSWAAPPDPFAACDQQAAWFGTQTRPNPTPRPELWWIYDYPCPIGSQLAGASPPAGRDLWCADRRGRRTGRRTTFAPNNLVVTESEWDRDREIGPLREWDPVRDVLVRTATFNRKGQLDGESIEWTAEGGVTVTTFAKGAREGATWRLDPRGRILLVEQYHLGERNGRSCAWRDGTLEVDQSYELGSPVRP